jgi:hypothetical protein
MIHGVEVTRLGHRVSWPYLTWQMILQTTRRHNPRRRAWIQNPRPTFPLRLLQLECRKMFLIGHYIIHSAAFLNKIISNHLPCASPLSPDPLRVCFTVCSLWEHEWAGALYRRDVQSHQRELYLQTGHGSKKLAASRLVEKSLTSELTSVGARAITRTSVGARAITRMYSHT